MQKIEVGKNKKHNIYGNNTQKKAARKIPFPAAEYYH